jgi:prepilin-type N-terminal cleavage/methylation domain-containing protein
MKKNMYTRKLFGRRGFTFMELLIASAILLIFVLAIFSVFMTSQRLLTVGLLQSRAGLAARTAIEQIGRAVYPCKSGSVSSDRINLVEDANHNPYSPNDVNKAVYVSNGTLIYDPNTAVGGNEITLATNVARIGTQSYFTVSGRAVTINFRVQLISSIVPTQSADVSTVIYLRN